MGKLEAPKYVETRVEKGKVEKLAKAVEKFYLIDILTPMLTTVGGKKIGTINYDHQRNTLIITDTKTALNKIEKVLKVLDTEPLQVVIDVKQVVTTNSDIVDFGLSFGTPEAPIKITTWPTIIPGASSPPGAKQTKLPFGLGHESPVSSTYFLTQYEVTAVLRAIKQDKFTKISQRPTIACLDNHEATIFVGQTVRFAETRVEYSQYGTPSKGIQEAKNSPVEIGFQLLVIPRVIRGTNRIMLTVVPTDSTLIRLDKYETPDYMIQLPQTSTTTLVTTLIIESGHTAVIGGLSVERTKYEENKIPILGDLPLINPLFKHTYKEKVKEHLLIFLTPRIVRSASDIVAELNRKLKQQQQREMETKK
jgi:type II secretory pathway component GspD/PulD (secretin)